MKLIYCPSCGDVVSLRGLVRYCHCKRSSGRYDDHGQAAKITGPAVPLGFANSSFRAALANRPNTGQGIPFNAFVIPKDCPTVKS